MARRILFLKLSLSLSLSLSLARARAHTHTYTHFLSLCLSGHQFKRFLRVPKPLSHARVRCCVTAASNARARALTLTLNLLHPLHHVVSCPLSGGASPVLFGERELVTPCFSASSCCASSYKNSQKSVPEYICCIKLLYRQLSRISCRASHEACHPQRHLGLFLSFSLCCVGASALRLAPSRRSASCVCSFCTRVHRLF